MGIKFGEIDTSQILENEFKIRVLEKIVEFLLNRNGTLHRPSTSDIENIKKEAIKFLQEKYPKSGISLKKE